MMTLLSIRFLFEKLGRKLILDYIIISYGSKLGTLFIRKHGDRTLGLINVHNSVYHMEQAIPWRQFTRHGESTVHGLPVQMGLNTLRPRYIYRHCTDIFKSISFNENVLISLITSLKFFLRFDLTIFQHWFNWWIGADQGASHYLNQWWLVYWRIYASLSFNELKTNQGVYS